MGNFKVLITDWGNTLCSTSVNYENIAESAAGIFTKNGVPMSATDYARISNEVRLELRKELAGDIKRHSLGIHEKRIATKLGKELTAEAAAAIDRQIFDAYLQYCHPRGGAKHFLEEIRKGGLKVILVSNSNLFKLSNEIRKIGFDKYLDDVICSEACGHEKSEGTPYRLAMEKAFKKKWASKASEFLVIGDREEEDGAARKLGIKVVILNSALPSEAEFDKILGELLSV
ncbi:hypothetical protein COU37_00120 [Candidatus Micrarchaeota archaeon CG10_big_fil_rev_8_21_14_0_10_45_29]|nr:MAG: hypothetical protein COU37_00120 [Candidatus Micrarchaeota archaeon CG10_big_fil_rev_8_21_14_0_10_45_29]